MSMSQVVPVTCPKCGKNGDFTRWQSINTELDPEMKKAVRDRSAFRYTCSHCGHSAIVDYPFLYHQMEDQIMIYYVGSEDELREVLAAYSEDSALNMLKYKVDCGRYLER